MDSQPILKQKQKPSKIYRCQNCHQPEWQQLELEGEYWWVQVHSRVEKNSLCTKPPCNITQSAFSRMVIFFSFRSHISSAHPLQYTQVQQEKQCGKEEKKKVKEKRKETKKEKETRRLALPAYQALINQQIMQPNGEGEKESR
jgi:hypothetical protein